MLRAIGRFVPQRTNQFQKLILHISNQLVGGSTEVTESKMLVDEATGDFREIDIFIEDPTDPFQRKVSIEVTSKSRKLDRTYVEQIKAKHDYLDSGQLIIVSKSGFAKKCFKYAKLHGIQLLTFDEAKSLDWPKWLMCLKELSLNHYRYQSLGAEVIFSESSDKNLDPKGALQVENSEYGALPIQAYIDTRFLDTEKEESIGRREGVKNWSFSPPLVLVDEDGIERDCTEIRLSYIEIVIPLDINMKYQEFLGKPVAYGISNNPGYFKQISMFASPSEQEAVDGSPKFNLSINVETHDT